MNLSQYDSFLHFVEVHGVTKTQIEECFGKDYFTKNPMYDNCRVINRLAKHLDMEMRVKTIYLTDSSVAFKIK